MVSEQACLLDRLRFVLKGLAFRMCGFSDSQMSNLSSQYPQNIMFLGQVPLNNTLHHTETETTDAQLHFLSLPIQF